MKLFWNAFEKRAMTNKQLLRKYYLGMLEHLKKSKDPTDRALHAHVKGKVLGMGALVPKKVREMGEAPSVAWRHDVHPEHLKNMFQEANANKTKPGWVRKKLMRDFGEAM